MKRLLTWARWEFGRPIEVTGVIKLIICERFLKFVVLVSAGLALLFLNDDIHNRLLTLQEQLNLNPGRGLFHRILDTILTKWVNMKARTQDLLAVAAILYGLLEGFEGVGLLMKRRWAEYLVLVATVVFIPYELDEVIRHVSVLKVLALAVNIAICVYLVWRKRLFIERPGHAEADVTTGASAAS